MWLGLRHQRYTLTTISQRFRQIGQARVDFMMASAHDAHTHWWPHGAKRWLRGASMHTVHVSSSLPPPASPPPSAAASAALSSS